MYSTVEENKKMNSISKEKGKELLVLLAITVVAAIPAAILTYIVDLNLFGKYNMATYTAIIAMIVYIVKEKKLTSIFAFIIATYSTIGTIVKWTLVIPLFGFIVWVIAWAFVLFFSILLGFAILTGAGMGFWGLLLFNIINFGLTFVGINIPTKTEKVINILCFVGGAIYTVTALAIPYFT